jgi:hypothetical protein
MLTKEIDHFYLKQEEPVKSCLLALRQLILSQDKDIVAVWKYGMPFFSYKNKMFCYLWYHKKHKQPYIGIVEGNHFNQPELIIEKRARMKIMLINPDEDIPVTTIELILKQAIDLCKKGIIQVK